jgi:hypothetical protein
MKCPHCDYIAGYYWVGSEYIKADAVHGEFWELPAKMEREVREFIWKKAQVSLYGCPCCKKTFIGEDEVTYDY